jgi:mannose-6-phosphate isomerase
MTVSYASLRPKDLSAWLKESFIPRWRQRTCVPGIPGYVEEVDASGEAVALPAVHTTMVTGRLVYTFSMAYRFDNEPETLRAAEHGLTFLLEHCRLSPGRFAHRMGGDGKVIDPHADLYDLAFVLLALGGYSAATGDSKTLAVAHEIADRLDREWIDPLGGYREPAGTGPFRLQYPQMHLFEAFQMLAAVDPAGGWLTRAERIVDLFARLMDEHGAIDEWFDSQWRALDPARRRREIGHHFEWAWLLFVHATSTGSTRAADMAWRAFNFGLEATGGAASLPSRPILNSIDAWGKPTSASRPLWPTIELAKAAMAAGEVRKDCGYDQLSIESMNAIFSQIDFNTLLWINDTSVNRQECVSTVPVRVLYHMVPCLIFFSMHLENVDSDLGTSAARPF